MRLKAAHVIRARQVAVVQGWTYLDPRPRMAPEPRVSARVRLRLLAVAVEDHRRSWAVCEGSGQAALNVRNDGKHVRPVGDCPICGHTAGVRTTHPTDTHQALPEPVMRPHQHGGPKR